MSHSQSSPRSPPRSSTPSPETVSAAEPCVPLPSRGRPSSKLLEQNSQHKVSSKPSTPKILFIGDSIIGHADLDVIADATKSKIVTAKAYTAIHDDIVNEVKDPAYFPEKNFLHVVPEQVAKDNLEYLVIQTGSVDITNMKTNKNPEKYLEYFKQETVIAAQNVFNSGLIALEHQPSLKSVVFLKQTPRYDPVDVDPLSIKAGLAHLFNNTLMNLWMNSSMREKIVVGTHNIDCSGAIQAARYRHTQTGRFDGVHLYGSSGSKAYTLSLVNILKAAKVVANDFDFHRSCPQTISRSKSNKYQGN